MLEKILRHLHNWFYTRIESGEWTIANGTITLPFLLPGQYFRICGSVFNDGVYMYPAVNLTNETFEGAIWALAIPNDVLALSTEIAGWVSTNSNALNSPYVSESFGGYSYSKGRDGDTSSATWETHFKSRLNPWRKL